MSAGICIMNSNAIAMAADSAVTIGDHIAIHNSANKLFSLSKIAPVGAIIYANSSFLGVPFEILIKEYKKFLDCKKFSTLKEYLTDFIVYLEKNANLFRFVYNEESYVLSLFYNLMEGIYGDYLLFCENKINEVGRELTEEEKLNLANDIVNKTKIFIDDQDKNSLFSFEKYIKTNYKNKFIDYLKNKTKFEWLSDIQINEISEKACEIFDSKFERNNYVGLAIAGYGEDEIYPSLIHVHLSGYINGKIRYYIFEEASITEQVNAYVVPLAQVDVMQTFLFGINDQFLGNLSQEIPKQITDCINAMNNNIFLNGNKQLILNQLVNVSENILEYIKITAKKCFMKPIMESVASLPIEELGLLAESMINITSVRRKMAIDRNIGTVGGPIDVSIISKGDGFIWLKRKHYFNKDYNPQFFYSHYN